MAGRVRVEDDPHREITDTDLTQHDDDQQREENHQHQDQRRDERHDSGQGERGDTARDDGADEPLAETAVDDERDQAAVDRAGVDEDTVHTPDADEIERTSRLAAHAAAELHNRHALDARREQDERSEQLDR